jgi:hypothetical protein
VVDHGEGGEDASGPVVKQAAGVALQYGQGPVDLLLSHVTCFTPETRGGFLGLNVRAAILNNSTTC